MKRIWYISFAILVIICWLFSPYSLQEIYSTSQAKLAPLVMIFGSFVAGISSVGGGAVAFPVFTLVLDVSPIVARNFSFAIQSVGMTSATLLMIDLKVRLHRPSLLWGTIGGVTGLWMGMIFQPATIDYSLLKLGFVSLWLSFGITLFYIFLKKRKSPAVSTTKVTNTVKMQLVAFGLIGGIITSFFGNGVDIIIFSLLVLRYNIDIRTATATSIILMTILTVVGFLGHAFVLNDFGAEEFILWMACVPIVMFGAPLGSFVLSRISQKSIAVFLISVIFIQYIGALFVLQPTLISMGYSLLIIAVGMLIFGSMRKKEMVPLEQYTSLKKKKKEEEGVPM